MNLALKKEDQLLCQDMKKLQIQDNKMVLLMNCCQNYLKLFDNVNRAKDNQYRNKMNSLFADSIDHSQGLGRSQEERAEQLLKYYQGIRQRFSDTNTNVLNIENQYFEFMSYSRQLQNAMLTIGKTQNVSMTKPESFTEIRSIQQFTNEVRQNHRRIRNFLEQLIECLFTWRYKVKTNNIEEGDYYQIVKAHQKAFELHAQIHITYLKVMGVTNVLETDRAKAQNIYQSVSSQYRNFLSEYIKVKEVYTFQTRLKEYIQIVQSQKNVLSAHLKKNYGMVVPYKKSQLYLKHIGNLETSDKRHLKRMVDKQIEPLQFAFKFINQDYEKLYKNACDGRDIRNEVNRINSQLQNYGSQSPKDLSYVVHLQQSCRRLMKIVK